MNKLLFLTYVFLINFSLLNCKCKTIDEVIAVVNNSVILKSEIDNFKKLMKLDNSFKEKNINDSELDSILLNQLIVDKMSYQIALEKDIIINNSDVDSLIEKLASQNFMSKDVFLKKIKSNNININNYKDFIKRKITNNLY